jgi:hypothetical protein
MNLELNKISTNNTELRINIKHMLDKRRKIIEEYNRLNIAMQNATDESRQLTSECSENFANRYGKFFLRFQKTNFCCVKY